MHLDTTMELAAIRQREIQHGHYGTTGRRPSGRRLFTRHVHRTTRTEGA